MKKNQLKRQWESARLSFARWKVFAVLEKHFRNCYKLRISRKFFNYWLEGLDVIKAEKKADNFHQMSENKRLLRQTIDNWKKYCIFLPWDSPDMRYIYLFIYLFIHTFI